MVIILNYPRRHPCSNFATNSFQVKDSRSGPRRTHIPGTLVQMTSRPTPWSSLPAGQVDLKLVITDMDGTLLDAQGTVPTGFWPILEVMQQRGISFAPASGRQFATLEREFAGADRVSFIAENGSLVVHDAEPLFTATVDADLTRRVISGTREAVGSRDLGLVLCGVQSAWIERTDSAFVDEVSRYYARLKVTDDLALVDEPALKLAVFDANGSQGAFDTVFARFADSHQVVISGKHWLDIMRSDVNKGRAVRALQERLGVTRAQTVIFGDYLNDLEMLAEADYSFAMANAHPDILAAARFVAPANSQGGVLSVLNHLLGISAS